MEGLFDRIEEQLDADTSPGASLRLALELRAAPDRTRVLHALRKRVLARPDDVTARILLIQVYSWMKGPEASNTHLKALLARTGSNVLRSVQSRILAAEGGRNCNITSRHVCFPESTIQNIGFWFHQLTGPHGTKEVITKIMHVDHVGTELLFYSTIRSAHPSLPQMSPGFIDLMQLEDLPVVLLTIERAAGTILDPTTLSADQVDELVLAYRNISDIPHGAVARHFGPPVTSNGLSHGYLASALHGVHTPDGFYATTTWLREAVIGKGYLDRSAQAVLACIDHIERISLHEQVVPDLHYAFLHGDLHRQNVLWDQGHTALLDWARCTTGPRGIDLVVLLRRFGHARLMELAARHEVIAKHDHIAQALFAYAMIIVSVEIDLPAIKNEAPEHLFVPAAQQVIKSLS